MAFGVASVGMKDQTELALSLYHAISEEVQRNRASARFQL